jgi:hypothetical protein
MTGAPKIAATKIIEIGRNQTGIVQWGSGIFFLMILILIIVIRSVFLYSEGK